MTSQPSATVQPERVASIDVIRGITILLMVFVNDLGPAAPAWMHHIQPPDADGMTLADIVFPFFLFIAGMSVPLAITRLRQGGHSSARILQHIMARSAALLLMGLIGVNRSADVRLGPTLWGLLSYLAIILAWCVVPQEKGPRRTILLTLKGIGIVGVPIMLAVYQREPVDVEMLFRGSVTGWTGLRTSWWGILGLIGWSYLLTGTISLLVGSRREWLLGAAGLLMLQFIVARQGGYFNFVDSKPWLAPVRPCVESLRYTLKTLGSYVDLGSILGSLPAIMMTGCVLGSTLGRDSDVTTARDRVRWSLTYAVGLFVAGLMTDTFGGINKIAATPTWCFWCASMATLLWLTMYLIVDVLRISRWTLLVRPAGSNPLIAYLLHPIILFVLSLTGLSGTFRAYAGLSAGPAIFGSLVMAAVVCALTGLFARAGLRLRL